MSKVPFNLSEVKAVIFDLGGVILNLDYDLTINAFKELGQSSFENLYTQANQDAIFDKYETGQISSNEFIKYLLALLPPNCKKNEVISAWNVMLLDLPKMRIDFLKEVALKLPTFLFSNTNELHYQSFKKYFEKEYGTLNLLEDIFEQCYYSHLVGERKPNASAFNTVLKDHNLKANEVLFIDDSIQHIEGAQKLGIKTIHLVDSDICDILTFS
jgi:glucose-1-phosphatase